jgi:YfiH family protein
MLPGDPYWMEQVHGTAVLEIEPGSAAARHHGARADAAVTRRRGTVLAVLTADCLPVVLVDRSARAVGIAHAGWRGLSAGVLDNTLNALLRQSGGQAADCVAWLGPAIGPRQFEVGTDVWQAFTDRDADHRAYFRPTSAEGKWWADLAGLARHCLRSLGVSRVEGGQWCTVEDAERFYSYRRDRVTGRMATLVWID